MNNHAPKMKESELVGDSFFIKDKNAYHKIMMKDIRYIQSDQNYCLVHLENRKFITKISLKRLFEKLPKDKFKRIHGRYVIGLEWLQRLNFTEGIIVLEGEKKLPVGRTYKQDLLETLQII